MVRLLSRASETRLRAVIGVVFVAGLVLSTWSWLQVGSISVALAFVAAAALTELLPAQVREKIHTSLTTVVSLTALLYSGPALAIASVLGIPAVGWYHYRDRRLQRTLFNFGQYSLSIGAASLTYVGLGGRHGQAWTPSSWKSWVAILLASLVAILVNQLLVAVAVRFESGERMLSTLRSLAGSALQILYAALSILAAALLLRVGPEALLFLIIPALVARYGLLGFQAEEQAYDRLVSSLLQAVEAKDGYTRGHTERVSTLCVEVARELGFGYDDVRAVRYAAKLHDVGKLGVPNSVINKPDALDDGEFEYIRAHPTVGADILSEIEFLRPALQGVRFHHERVDGRGYPFGVHGDQLPMVARIITVCDAFDAMTTTRTYRRAMAVDDAFEELHRCAGSQFDERVVEALERVADRLEWEPTYEAYEEDGSHPSGHDQYHDHLVPPFLRGGEAG